MSLDHAILGFLNYRRYSGYDLKKIFDKSVRHFWPADQSQIYLTLGNYLMAKKHLDPLFENYPGDYETNLSLGWTYYYLGSKTKAQEAFINAMSAYPADTSAVKGYGLTK